jgi:hypothetical protein
MPKCDVCGAVTFDATFDVTAPNLHKALRKREIKHFPASGGSCMRWKLISRNNTEHLHHLEVECMLLGFYK